MNMRYLFVALMLMLILIPSVANAENASSSVQKQMISIYIDGEKLNSEVSPAVLDSRTYVPIRVIAEKWGARVGWNSEEQLVRLIKDRKSVDLYIGQKEVLSDGKLVYTDAPPVILEGRTMLPLRFVGELLGAEVNYDDQSRTVAVKLPVAKPAPEVPVTPGGSVPDPSVPIGGAPSTPPQTSPDRAKVMGIDITSNQLVIRTDKMVKASSFYLSDPHRIVLDFTDLDIQFNDPQAVFDAATNQYKRVVDGDGLIESVRYAYLSATGDKARVVIDLSDRARYSMKEEANGVTLDLLDAGNYLVVLDPGHGGKDPGAINQSGRQEKEFNLSVALLVQQLLEAEPKIDVMMTRSSDVFLELKERTDLSNGYMPDAFLSIHANSSTSTSARGTETYYAHDNQQKFASIIHRHLVEATGFPDRKLIRNNFFVTRNSTGPAALIEVGFLSNPQDAAQMETLQMRQRVAQALVRAFKEYFGV